MSPVDPISPTSPMSISPSSPTNMDYRFDIPSQPVLVPTVHLPRLITSFQTTGSNRKRMSMQFQLPTPSPLSLGQTPITAIQRRASTPLHRRSNAMSAVTPLELISTSTFPNLPSPRTPRQDMSPAGAPSSRKIPTLQRQDAMEGLEAMGPIVEQVITLPLRTTRRPSEAARHTSFKTQSVPETSLSTTFSSKSRTHSRSHRRRSSASSASSSRIRPRSPIHKHHRRSQSLQAHQRSQRHYFDGLIDHLRNELIPLISVRTGESHPAFPRSILQYQLLTHDQLDDLARHYHQTIDAGEERWLYPCPIGWGKVWCGSVPATTSTETDKGRRLVDLKTKRRRWGRFIGLKNCESPTTEDEEGARREMDHSMRERMEKDWRESLRRQEEEYRAKEKMMRRYL